MAYVGRGELQCPNCQICADRGYLPLVVFIEKTWHKGQLIKTNPLFANYRCPGCGRYDAPDTGIFMGL